MAIVKSDLEHIVRSSMRNIKMALAPGTAMPQAVTGLSVSMDTHENIRLSYKTTLFLPVKDELSRND